LPQIALWQPALALVLGRNASRAALGVQLQTASLSALRGQTFDMASVAARVSYPLEYLLRKPDAKASAWQDWLALKWQWEALQST
jgi:uracil-DNA glycosylase